MATTNFNCSLAEVKAEITYTRPTVYDESGNVRCERKHLISCDCMGVGGCPVFLAGSRPKNPGKCEFMIGM